MAQYQESYPQQVTRRPETRGVSGLSFGFIAFAATMLAMLAFFHFVAGLTAVIGDTFYAVRSNYALELDVSLWGWLHIVGGIALGFVSIGLLTGSVVARVVAILLALGSIVWNFYSIPYYPVWSILMIAIAIGITWALVVHGGDLKSES